MARILGGWHYLGRRQWREQGIVWGHLKRCRCGGAYARPRRQFTREMTSLLGRARYAAAEEGVEVVYVMWHVSGLAHVERLGLCGVCVCVRA
eukprot:10592626-Alexandrium_andersonii.AAC.1